MKKKLPPKKVVNTGVSALAREVGVTPTTISKKLRAGQTPEQIRQEAARKEGRAPTGGRPSIGRPSQAEYDLVLARGERLNNLDEAKLRRARALAERSELENMLKRDELIPVAYVRQWASRFLTDGRDMLLTGPSELADTLAAESDPLRCAAILRAWLERVMGKFHQLEKLWGAGEEEQVA